MPSDLAHPPSTEARAALRIALARVRELQGEGARVLYRLGEVLRDVEDQELWRASGQPSYALWLEEEAGVARGTAHRAVNVVRNFSEELAARYGFDKLYQGLRYLELTRAVEQPGDIVALDLRVRGASGRFERVPFHTATVRDILDAIELLQRRARGLPDGLDHAVENAVTRLVAELPPPPTGIRAAKQRVEVLRTRGGQVAITVKQVGLDDLDETIAALQAMRDALRAEEGVAGTGG